MPDRTQKPSVPPSPRMQWMGLVTGFALAFAALLWLAVALAAGDAFGDMANVAVGALIGGAVVATTISGQLILDYRRQTQAQAQAAAAAADIDAHRRAAGDRLDQLLAIVTELGARGEAQHEAVLAAMRQIAEAAVEQIHQAGWKGYAEGVREQFGGRDAGPTSGPTGVVRPIPRPANGQQRN